eukprot:g4964.t1
MGTAACKLCCNPVTPPPENAQCYIGKWVMEVTGRDNPAEGAVTHWDVDDHQAALYSDGLCQKTHAFFLTKPIDEENGTITMRMDGMKYRKKVEGGEIVSPKPVRNRLVTDDDDDDDDQAAKSNKPVEISI